MFQHSEWERMQADHERALKLFDLRLERKEGDYDWETFLPIDTEPFTPIKSTTSEKYYYWIVLITEEGINHPYRRYLSAHNSYKSCLRVKEDIDPTEWKREAAFKEERELALLNLFIETYGAEKLEEWEIKVHTWGPGGELEGKKDGKRVCFTPEHFKGKYLEERYLQD